MEKILNVELLSKILKDKVKKIIGIEDNSLKYLTESYGFGEGIICSINIYELIHLMEEWVFNKDYHVNFHKSDITNKYTYQVFNKHDELIEFDSDDKLKAITNLCQWVSNGESYE